MGAAGGGELVVAGAPVVLGDAPFRAEEAFFLEAVDGLVEGGVVEVQRAVGGALEPGDDLEAVHRSPAEGAEDEEVEGAFEDGQLAHLRNSIESLEGR